MTHLRSRSRRDQELGQTLPLDQWGGSADRGHGADALTVQKRQPPCPLPPSPPCQHRLGTPVTVRLDPSSTQALATSLPRHQMGICPPLGTQNTLPQLPRDSHGAAGSTGPDLAGESVAACMGIRELGLPRWEACGAQPWQLPPTPEGPRAHRAPWHFSPTKQLLSSLGLAMASDFHHIRGRLKPITTPFTLAAQLWLWQWGLPARMHPWGSLGARRPHSNAARGPPRVTAGAPSHLVSSAVHRQGQQNH